MKTTKYITEKISVTFNRLEFVELLNLDELKDDSSLEFKVEREAGGKISISWENVRREDNYT